MSQYTALKRKAQLLESVHGIKYDGKPAKDIINQMANGYCKAKDEGDEYNKDLFISGLMLRFWNQVGNLQEKSPNLKLDQEDFEGWLYDAIELACQYRAWQKNPKVNAQQCINQCITTIRVRNYYQFNLGKHSANYNTTSLDNPIDDENKVSIIDTIVDEEEENRFSNMLGAASVRRFIQGYVDKKKLVEAIIFDIIAFNDTQKTTYTTKTGINEEGESYKYKTGTVEFVKRKCVNLLLELPEDYYNYFTSAYHVPSEELLSAINAIRTSSKGRLDKSVDKVLAKARLEILAAM